MRQSRVRLWQGMVLFVLVGLLAVGGCKTTPPEGDPEEGGGEGAAPGTPTGPHADLAKLLPGSADITNWKPDGPAEIFATAPDPATGVKGLEADVGPAAGAYQTYEYVASAKRTYVRGQAGETMTVRVFNMKTPSEAFGVFSVRAGGDQFPLVGLAARMSATALGFVKGSYYVALEYRGTGDARPALMEFGRWVADQVTSPGYRPALLETFPLGSVAGQRYYLHEFETLASLRFVPQGEPTTMARMLGLSGDADVGIMGYSTSREGVLNYLFVIKYPTSVDASAAYTAYNGYLESSDNPTEKNVAVAPPVGAYLAGTFNAEENSINDRLAKLLESLGG